MSDIDTAAVDSLKALDPERPIREGDIGTACLVVDPIAGTTGTGGHTMRRIEGARYQSRETRGVNAAGRPLYRESVFKILFE